MTAELTKLAKRPAIWVVGAVWMVLSLLFGYVFPYVNYTGSPAGPGAQVLSEALPAALVPAAIQGFPMFAGALALLIGVLATGSEYGWDTVKVLFTIGPRRLEILASKVAALAIVMLVAVLATFAVDAGASVLVATLTGHPTTWPPLTEILTGIGAGWLIVGMWCLAGALLGIAVRGTALAIGIGLVWALVVENLLRTFAALVDAVDVVQRLMPGTNAGALAAALDVPAQGQTGGTPGITAVVGGTSAALTLAVYVALFLAVAALLTTRRDVV